MSSPLDAVTGAKKPKRTRPAGAMFTVKIPLPPGATGYAASLMDAGRNIYPPAFQLEGDYLVSRPDAWPAFVRVMPPGGGTFDIPFTPPASGTEGLVDTSLLGGGEGAETGGGGTGEAPPTEAAAVVRFEGVPDGWSIVGERTEDGRAFAFPSSGAVTVPAGPIIFEATRAGERPRRTGVVSLPPSGTAGIIVLWRDFTENPYRGDGTGPNPLPNQAPPFGLVTIGGITPGLSLEIDGQPVAVTTELPTLRIPAGAHRFVFKDVMSAQNGPQNVPVRAEQTITVRAGDNLTITPDYSASWEAATRGQGGGGGFPWLLAAGVAALGYYAWSQSQADDKRDE